MLRRITPESMAFGCLGSIENACQHTATVKLDWQRLTLGILVAVGKQTDNRQQREMASLGVPVGGSRSTS